MRVKAVSLQPLSPVEFRLVLEGQAGEVAAAVLSWAQVRELARAATDVVLSPGRVAVQQPKASGPKLATAAGKRNKSRRAGEARPVDYARLALDNPTGGVHPNGPHRGACRQ